jgi:hypothetical protein
MTFNKAKRLLKRMAKGEYCAIQYDVTLYSSEREYSECRVYVEGYDFHMGKTWKEALKKLKVAMKPVNREYKKPDEREEPK